MEVQKMIGIYKFENNITHNIYIGQSINIEKRYKDHLSRAKHNNKGNNEYNTPLHRAIRKYGIENFTFSIIEECSKDILNDKEQYWIDFYDSFENGYNLTSGGEAQEASRKFDEMFISQIQKILLNTDETYNEISNKYDISTGRISEINTGKVGYNKDFSYPLRKRKKYVCEKCGKEIYKGSKLCIYCYNLSRRKTKRPSREELKEMIRNIPFIQIGKKYNVSDSTIRKWCDSYNLPRTKKQINNYSNENWNNI